MRYLPSSLPLLGTMLLLTGCGFTVDKTPLTITPTGQGMHGIVHGGQAPIVGATVSVYSVGVGTTPTLLASTTSDANGNFAFSPTAYSCGSILAKGVPVSTQQVASPHAATPRAILAGSSSASNSKVGGGPTGAARSHPATLPDPDELYVYITAVGGDAGSGTNSRILLGAGLGKCIDAQTETVEINEVSTVVLANVIANFAGPGLAIASSNDSHQINAMELALTNTFQTVDDLPTGTVKPNTVSTTGGTSITIEAAKIYSIANTIASCVNSADQAIPTPGTASNACQTLFANATFTTPGDPGSVQTSIDTFTAALYMCLSPYSNVTALYNLAGPEAPFPAGLPGPPNDWSVGISYSTAAMGLEIYESVISGGSSSTIDLDSNSRVWFPSNKSGAVGLAYFDPTTNTFNGPYNHINSVTLRNDLTLPQYVALDDVNQLAWITDMQSGEFVGFDTTPGSEGTAVYAYNFYDDLGGSSKYATGPLFVNSDSSLVINFDDSNGVPEVRTFTAGNTTLTNTSYLTLQPTGLTVNTIQGNPPYDPASPSAEAATSSLTSGKCNVEFSSTGNGNFVFTSETSTSGCLSGGVATTQFDGPNFTQDQVAIFTTTNSFCSGVLEHCSDLPEYLSSPKGVAVDGANEVWIANRGNGSLFYLQGAYSSSGTPSYSLVSNVALLHGDANGGTMTKPTGIAVDRGGNIWVSNTNCVGTNDTTCIFTLSEVFGTAYPTFTPLSLQAARLQGRPPPFGGAEAGFTPQPMHRSKPSTTGVSVLRK